MSSILQKQKSFKKKSTNKVKYSNSIANDKLEFFNPNGEKYKLLRAASYIKQMYNKIDPYEKIVGDKISERKHLLEKYLENQEYDKAKIELTRLLFFKSDDKELLIKMAFVCEQLGLYDKGIIYLKKAQKIEDDMDIQAFMDRLMILKGNKMVEEKIFDDHIEILSPNRSIDEGSETWYPSIKNLIIPNQDSVNESPEQQYLLKSLVLMSENKKKEAIIELDHCTEKYPDYIYAYIVKAKLYFLNRAYKYGIKEMWKAYELDPEHPEIKEFVRVTKEKTRDYYQKAIQYYFEKDIAKSMYFIQKGLEFDEREIKFYLLRSHIRKKKGEFHMALRDIEEALGYAKLTSEKKEISKNLAILYNEMGIKEMENGKYSEAIVLFNEATKFKKEDWGILVNKGDCLRNLKKYDDAIIAYKGAEIIGDRKPDILKRLGLTYFLKATDYFNMKEYKSATVELQKALNCDEYNLDYLILLGKCYTLMNDVKTASQYFNKALEINPNNISIMNLAGQYTPFDAMNIKINSPITRKYSMIHTRSNSCASNGLSMASIKMLPTSVTHPTRKSIGKLNLLF